MWPICVLPLPRVYACVCIRLAYWPRICAVWWCTLQNTTWECCKCAVYAGATPSTRQILNCDWLKVILLQSYSGASVLCGYVAKCVRVPMTIHKLRAHCEILRKLLQQGHCFLMFMNSTSGDAHPVNENWFCAYHHRPFNEARCECVVFGILIIAHWLGAIGIGILRHARR